VLRYLCLALLGLIPLQGFGKLEWETTTSSIVGDPFNESAQTSFKFTNRGPKTVKITSAFSQCGCTVPSLTKWEYAPGESGEVHAVFKFGQSVGHEAKEITVTTDEPADVRTYKLHLEINLPPKLFDLSPQMVTWKIGEPAAPKRMRITIARPDVHPVTVSSRDKHIAATVEPDPSAPNAYDVVLTPSTTATELWAPILVNMNLPQRNPRVLIVYAKVLK
jgi:hypothetical protein